MESGNRSGRTGTHRTRCKPALMITHPEKYSTLHKKRKIHRTARPQKLSRAMARDRCISGGHLVCLPPCSTAVDHGGAVWQTATPRLPLTTAPKRHQKHARWSRRWPLQRRLGTRRRRPAKRALAPQPGNRSSLCSADVGARRRRFAARQWWNAGQPRLLPLLSLFQRVYSSSRPAGGDSGMLGPAFLHSDGLLCGDPARNGFKI